jgi:exopolysaccharide biosynthesis protein
MCMCSVARPVWVAGLAAALASALLSGCLPSRWAAHGQPPQEHGQPLECETDQPPQPPTTAGDTEAVGVAPSADTPTSGPENAPVAEPVETKPAPPPEKPQAPPPAPKLPRGEVRKDSRQVAAAGKTFSVTFVDVPLGSATLKLGLAKGRVGCTEDLASIARRAGAIAAIDGCFFDAYSNRPVRNPYGNLMSGGQVLSIADHPTTLGVWPDGKVAIGQVKFHIKGDSGHHESWFRPWYAYALNQYPEQETCATIFTPRWSQSRSPEHGMYTVVRDGRIAEKGYGSAPIPADGYVIYLRGAEAQLDKRFESGRDCTYEVTAESSDGLDWLSAQEALGCGPLLVRNGQVSVDPQAERFRDPKVLNNAGNRSAVGLTPDGHLLMVTCSSATMTQFGHVMKALGCRDAMNLDGGASSSLFLRDTYLVKPGRDISNALLVLAR